MSELVAKPIVVAELVGFASALPTSLTERVASENQVLECVIASAAKQSRSAYGAKWIASSQRLLAMTGKQLYVIGDISSQSLRSPAARSEVGRLEGWRLARPSPVAILRDASLARCSSGWGSEGCRYDTNFKVVGL